MNAQTMSEKRNPGNLFLNVEVASQGWNLAHRDVRRHLIQLFRWQVVLEIVLLKLNNIDLSRRELEVLATESDGQIVASALRPIRAKKPLQHLWHAWIRFGQIYERKRYIN